MKVYISFDSDQVGHMLERASLSDKPEEAAKIAQALERGNEIWRSWAESHGGRTINLNGDKGRICVEADHLEELPKIRDQYTDAVGSTVSVGVGTLLSEADKSLKAAKAQGGDRIQLYTDEVNEILEEMEDNSIAKASGEGSEHSEAEVARQTYGQPVPTPGKPQDYEQLFHQAAAQTPEEQPQKPTGLQDSNRAKVIQILQSVRNNAPKLEELQSKNPELYNTIKELVQAMIAMAQSQSEGQSQPVQKSESDLAKAVIHDDYDKPMTVYRMQNAVGAGPYSIGIHKRFPDQAHVKNQENAPNFVEDMELPTRDDWSGKDSHGLMFGFHSPEHAMNWFGPKNMAYLQQQGFGVVPVKARKVWGSKSGKQLLFHPHFNEQLYRSELDKAALEAGKTGRHQVVLPVGAQVDPGPSAAHEGGEIKIRDPESGKTKWRSVRAGLVMAPDGTPTSSRNPGG